MTTTVPQTRTDPLHAFVAGAFIARSKQPLPLTDTRFHVEIDGGLAIVSTARTFRNAEAQPIEATITFPVPVHATLFELKARIGERVLAARARRKQEARESYESAIDRGKTAILHEEVLRGVHMLSVGQLAPGVEIEVQSRFALSLANSGGGGTLRIPLTVGDIYGRSPLHDSDDLASSGRPGALARLTVVCADGSVALAGGTLEDGSAWVPLDAPIDLAVTDWSTKDLRGRAADGREVVVRIEPAPAGDAALDLAVVVDRSGSMGEMCDEAHLAVTKHMAVVQGLDTFARDVHAADRIDMWQFNETLVHVGWIDGNEQAAPIGRPDGAQLAPNLRALLRCLSGPAGGTEIGSAIEGVFARSAARDVLLITDGKSHALDVHRFARHGRRVSIVLVGEDSLEANVGHLAALTEGEIFVAAGLDVKTVLQAAIGALRAPREKPVEATAPVHRAAVRRGGMIVAARWGETLPGAESAPQPRGVAAFAASLALPLLPSEAAGELAEAEGLVSHLTSLVLVDEAAQGEIVVPATRKVPLPEPRTASAAPARMLLSACLSDASARAFRDVVAERAPPPMAEALRLAEEESRRRPEAAEPCESSRGLHAPPRHSPAPPRRPQLRDLAMRIEWNAAPAELQAGNLWGLDPATARAICEAAARPDVTEIAHRLGVDPRFLVIGLLARAASAGNRSAARIARAILGAAPAAEIRAAAALLGLA